MKLVGRKITRNVKPAANAEPTAVVNPVNGSIRLSKKVIDSCDLEGKTVSIALPEEEGEKTYLYVTSDPKDGFKVSNRSISGRSLARELADNFGIERTDKFSISIKTEAVTFPESEFEGIEFFEITFKESLGTITAKKDKVEKEVENEEIEEKEEKEVEEIEEKDSSEKEENSPEENASQEEEEEKDNPEGRSTLPGFLQDED